MKYDVVNVISTGNECQKQEMRGKIQRADCDYGPYFPIWPKSVRLEIVHAWLIAHDANLKDTLTGNIRPLKDYEPDILDMVRHIDLYKAVMLLVSPDGLIQFEPLADIIQQREGLRKSMRAIDAISQAENIVRELSINKVIERSLKCGTYAPARAYYSSVRELFYRLKSQHPNLDAGINVSELAPGFSMAFMALAINHMCGPGIHVAPRDIARLAYGAGVPRGNQIIIKVKVEVKNIIHVGCFNMNGTSLASDKLRIISMHIPRRCIETMYHYNKPPHSMSREQYDAILKEWGCTTRHQTSAT